MIKRILSSIFLCFFFLVGYVWAGYEKFYGIYALPTGGRIDPKVITYPFVKGISIRIPWKVLEPERGVFDWDRIEKIISLAKKEHKYVNIRILAGVYSPEWIFSDPNIPKIKFICRNPNKKKFYGKSVTMPVLWDRRYLEEYYRFLRALGQKFDKESSIFWVAVSGPVTGPATPHLPKNPQTLRLFKKYGFKKDLWLEVWKEAIDQTAQAFPDKAISLCLDVPPFYMDMAGELARYAVTRYSGRICLQSNGLSAKVFKVLRTNSKIKYFLDLFPRYADKAIIGFQMTWAAAWKNRGRDRLGPLDKAIEAGLKLKASYLEIYQDDIVNRANWSILENAASRLSRSCVYQSEEEVEEIAKTSGRLEDGGSVKHIKPGRRLRQILQQLDLSSEQKRQIRQCLRELREERRAGKSPREIREKLLDNLKTILTPEQFNKFKHLWSEST